MTRNQIFGSNPGFVRLCVRCDSTICNNKDNGFAYLWDKNIGEEFPVDQEIAVHVPEYVIVSDDATCVVSEKIEVIDRNGLPIRTIVLVFHCKNNEICKHSRFREALLYGDWASVGSVSRQ